VHYEVKKNLATRAFATNADILLCDEPFSGPDESAAGRLLGEFVQLVKENGQDGRVHHSLDQ
jgi:NitT/TauT family transport system ATP-binding protein